MKKVKINGKKFRFGFEKHREMERHHGVLLLFRKGELVYVQASSDVFREVASEKHVEKNFDEWNFVPAHYEDLEDIAFDIIDKYDPIYSPAIPF